jgi:cytochrome c oxidase subunit 4
MSEKIVSLRVYVLVFAVLAILALVTYKVAFIDLGRMNTVIALAIAVGKAVLVALYFMHVRYSPRLTWAVIGGGLFWLGIMIVLVMSDYLTRSWLRYPN